MAEENNQEGGLDNNAADNNRTPRNRAAPAAPVVDNNVLSQLAAAIMGEGELQRRLERDRVSNMLAQHDRRRAELPTHTLVATTAFTLVDDDHPEGRVVNMGEEFEVSEFDLARYIGRGLPRKNDPDDAKARGTGVTVSQA